VRVGGDLRQQSVAVAGLESIDPNDHDVVGQRRRRGAARLQLARLDHAWVGAQIERNPVSTAGLTFGVNVSIPLFARYGFDGEIARAEADYTSAVLTRQKVENQAAADVARARVALESARQRLASFETAIVPAAKQALDAIEFAYARGAAGLTDALDARRTWRATQVDVAAARADHAKALVAWRAATEWEVEPP